MSAQELVDWMTTQLQVSRPIARSLGQSLVDALLIKTVQGGISGVFRDHGSLIIEFAATSVNSPLNWTVSPQELQAICALDKEDPVQLSLRLLGELQGLISSTSLHRQHERNPPHMHTVTHTGMNDLGGVIASDVVDIDVVMLKNTEDYRRFVVESRCLRCIDLIGMSRKDLKSFFLNVAQLLCRHEYIEREGHNSYFCKVNCWLDALSFKLFFPEEAYRYNIGGYMFSYFDIKHGVLRANHRPPYFMHSVFDRDDPRLDFTESHLDPRVVLFLSDPPEFPPLQGFYGDNIDLILDAYLSFYLHSSCRFSSREIVLPRSLLKYSKDIGTNIQQVLKWVVNMLDVDDDTRSFLRGCLFKRKEFISKVTYSS
eukprot:GHVR01011943.1.p1 GENE.GHVR01011943.1~~GHVR01011943.1.p1  ORF type:complete len:370 (+),score=59.13 GHVR01011943.1:595-1704(+)